jgi:hypothetical protein
MIHITYYQATSGTLRMDIKKTDMYRESEKNIELEKKLLELKAELKNEQEKTEILNKMLELAKINPSGLADLINGLQAKD